MATPLKRGWSFARILLVTAVVGTVAGTLLGTFVAPPEEPEVVAEREVARLMPRQAPAESGDEMAPDPASLSGIPPYPGVYPRRLARQATAQGGPMSISWFTTEAPTGDVLDFYERAFRADGRRPFKQRRGPDMGYVAWLDAHTDGGLGAGVLHMVSAMKQFSQTVVLISASRPDMAMNSSPKLPEGLELPPSSTEPQVVEMGESALANRIVYARSMNVSPAEVVEFFVRQFKERGFEVADQNETPLQAGVTGKKGATAVVVVARAEGNHSSVVITYDRQMQEGVSP